ncbi:MAG: MATE family efflux transporter [Armatimonadota bacterium]
MGTELNESQTRSKATEIITSGSISKAVWYIAWPTIVNTGVQTAHMNINRLFLGRVPDSAAAMAGLTVGSSASMLQFAIATGFSVGAGALVARFLGAREHADANEAARQSLILAVLCGILTMVPMILFATPFVRLIGAKGEVVTLGARYMAILGAFSIPVFIQMSVTSALRSAGDVRRPLYAGLIVIVLNILLDWLLIFGVGPFPALGLIGAAIATGISKTAGMTVILIFLKRSVLGDSLSHFRPHFGWFRRISNIGWPAAVQQVFWASGMAVYMAILGCLPDAKDALAALGVASAIETISIMPGIAYSMAAVPLVGQNLGASQPKRAEHCAWITTWQATAIMSFCGLIFLLASRPIAMLYTNDSHVVAYIASYLVINSFQQPFVAVGAVLAGALQGAGDTKFPTLVEFIANYPIRLGLAWLFAIKMGHGVAGAWVGMSAAGIIWGIMMLIWFRKGYWKTLSI